VDPGQCAVAWRWWRRISRRYQKREDSDLDQYRALELEELVGIDLASLK
jgi:hypothetical protein